MPITRRAIAIPLLVAASCIFVATALFMAGVIPGYHLVWTRDVTGAMAGERISLDAPVYRYDSERGFQGDGYTFMVLEPGGDFMARFESPSESFMSRFPRPPEYRSNWEVMKWRRGPVDQEDEPLMEFALGWLEGEDTDLNGQQDELREVLGRDTTLYGAFYLMHDERPGDIDLYVVDAAGGRIYLVNLNT